MDDQTIEVRKHHDRISLVHISGEKKALHTSTLNAHNARLLSLMLWKRAEELDKEYPSEQAKIL